MSGKWKGGEDVRIGRRWSFACCYKARPSHASAPRRCPPPHTGPTPFGFAPGRRCGRDGSVQSPPLPNYPSPHIHPCIHHTLRPPLPAPTSTHRSHLAALLQADIQLRKERINVPAVVFNLLRERGGVGRTFNTVAVSWEAKSPSPPSSAPPTEPAVPAACGRPPPPGAPPSTAYATCGEMLLVIIAFGSMGAFARQYRRAFAHLTGDHSEVCAFESRGTVSVPSSPSQQPGRGRGRGTEHNRPWMVTQC